MPLNRPAFLASVCDISSLLASTVAANWCSADTRLSQAVSHFAWTVPQLSPAVPTQSAWSWPDEDLMSPLRDSTLACAFPIAPDRSWRSLKLYAIVIDSFLRVRRLPLQGGRDVAGRHLADRLGVAGVRAVVLTA